jgi:putative holliday junction resolvase
MRLMALDYGTHSIGVAVCDELRLAVRPLTTIRRKGPSRAAVIAKIRELVAEYEPMTLVVGLPLRMDGTSGDAAERVQRFIADLQRELNIPVAAQDERLTSREADELMREQGLDARERRARSDEYAAAVILQDYLASNPPAENSPAEENFPAG